MQHLRYNRKTFNNCSSFGTPKLNPIDGNDPLLLTGSQATLIGWANNRVDTTSDVTVNGVSSSGTFEDFIQAPLNIDLSQSSSLSPGFIYGQVINAQGNEVQTISPGIYTINMGSITFEFALPAGGNSRVSNLTVPSTQNYTTNRDKSSLCTALQLEYSVLGCDYNQSKFLYNNKQ